MFTSFSSRGLFRVPLVLLILSSSVFANEFRIVSLSPSITKQLITLGEKENIAGCTSFCPLANDKDSKSVVVGSAMSTNIESIVSLKPDIVFASSLTGVKVINKLKSLNIRVEIFPYPTSIEKIFEDFIRLGKIVNKGKIAEQIVKTAEDNLNKIIKTYKSHTPKKVFFEIGADPLFSTPKNTYIADILTKVNALNIAENLNQGQISKEWLIRENPEVILIMDMGDIAVQEIKNWKKFKSLSATENNKIFILDADSLASPVLPDFINLINHIGELIHK